MLDHIFLQFVKIAHAQTAGGFQGVTGGSGGGTGGSEGVTGGGGIDLINPLGQGTTLLGLIHNIFTYLTYIAVLVAPFMVLYAAFQILTAGDNPEKFESGKKTLLYTIIGFGIILISSGLIVVIQQILGVQNPVQP